MPIASQQTLPYGVTPEMLQQNPNLMQQLAIADSLQLKPLPPEMIDVLKEKINSTLQNGLPSLEAQRSGITDLEQLRNALLQQPSQVNLAPAFNLVDPSGQMAKTYTPPTTGEERQVFLNKIQQGIQKEKAGLSENEINLLKTQLNAVSADELAQIKGLFGLAGQQVANEGKVETAKIDKEGKANKPTMAETDLSKKYNKIYVDFGSGGGASEDMESITRLRNFVAKLEKSTDLTGPGKGLIPFKSVTDPELKLAIKDAATIANKGLKATFGGSGLTDAERIAQTKSIFDPEISVAENLKNFKILLKKAESGYEAKKKLVDYRNAKGSFEGFQAEVPDLNKPATTETLEQKKARLKASQGIK